MFWLKRIIAREIYQKGYDKGIETGLLFGWVGHLPQKIGGILLSKRVGGQQNARVQMLRQFLVEVGKDVG